MVAARSSSYSELALLGGAQCHLDSGCQPAIKGSWFKSYIPVLSTDAVTIVPKGLATLKDYD